MNFIVGPLQETSLLLHRLAVNLRTSTQTPQRTSWQYRNSLQSPHSLPGLLMPDYASLILYGLLPFCEAKIVMVLRCNCFRISGFSLDSFSIRAMMEFARKIHIDLAALPCNVLGREPMDKTE